MKTTTRLNLGCFLLISLDQCKQPSVPVPINASPTRDNNMAMGNPDGAKATESSPNAYLITQPDYFDVPFDEQCRAAS